MHNTTYERRCLHDWRGRDPGCLVAKTYCFYCVGSKLRNIVSEIFCIFKEYYILVAGVPLETTLVHDAVLFHPPAAFSN
jgi:hypothetical protein